MLILSLSIASVGFIIWFTLSSSLRLPVRYQIMYDANPPYVNRIIRRRILGFIIYAGIPLFIIFCTNWVKKPSLADIHIHFTWNSEVALYTGIGAAVMLIISLFSTRSDASLEQYPEVRVRFWRRHILIKSALSWLIYIPAIEFFYRGILLQSLNFYVGEATAIIACTALYGLSHYFRRNRLTALSLLWGTGACLIVLQTGSLLPVMIIHLVLALSVEWLSIKHHREMYVLRT